MTGSRLRLIGGGEEDATLRGLAESPGVGDKVEITGFVSRGEALRKLASCDVLLHPSTHDSGGWACSEGMAAGLPVVCLDWGGPGAQVTADTGFRIPVADENTVIENMADALRRLSNPFVRFNISAACKIAVRTGFGWESKAKRFSELHEHIWENGRD